MQPIKTYPSKILLFGEYTVLLEGQALAVPHLAYHGFWSDRVKNQSREKLSLFLQHLKKINHDLHAGLDLESFQSLMDNGFYFQSNIPQGMGLGSSAALAASIYDRFTNPSALTLAQKKADLGLIESFFHGISSGFDALVSLEQCTLMIDQSNQIHRIKHRAFTANHIYILSTKLPRQTQNLVSWFQTSCSDLKFSRQMQSLTQLNNQAIQRYLKNDPLSDVLNEISRLQYKALRHLIPDALSRPWENTLSDENIAIKLLGAGGGGCYLLFTKIPIEKDCFYGFEIKKI